MAGLLSGLEEFGLGKLEGADLYESDKAEIEKAEQSKVVEKKDPLKIEMDMLFDKTYTCPVCDAQFKQKTVKANRARPEEPDMDLRPRYDGIDMLKYDVVLCPRCGYAALGRYFSNVTVKQAQLIRKHISATFRGEENLGEVYSYDTALARYKLALATAIVRMSKASEKAYICLKAGWLIRGMAEQLDPESLDYTEQKEECDKAENEFLKNALDGFLVARENENYPICGMDEHTFEYLIAVLAMRFQQYQVASKLIAGILLSRTASTRIKDKAREVKELLLEKVKQEKAET